MALDGQSLLGVDLNPANDGRLDGVLSGEESSLQVQFGPELDLQLSVGEWSKVLDPLPDFIPFQTNENIAIQMAGTDAPSFQILWDEEDAIDMQVITGTLTLSSSMMEDAVVVSEGQCMGSIDTDGWSEEDKDALHPLFGELTGETCSL